MSLNDEFTVNPSLEYLSSSMSILLASMLVIVDVDEFMRSNAFVIMLFILFESCCLRKDGLKRLYLIEKKQFLTTKHCICIF